MSNSNELMVSIRCLTYNHSGFIRQCLEGFVNQKTHFRFEAIVHDDASTDGTDEIIKEYAEKYPDIIKPIYESENQYSKKDGSLARIINAHLKGKYVAMCEGDDFWTDPYKLQKQVDYLEAHPQCVMCCSDAHILTDKGELDWSRYYNDRVVPTHDIIMGGGLYLHTASLTYRRELLDNNIPLCHVADYPLQIYASLLGDVYYFAEKQVAYRYCIGQSWTSTINQLQFDIKVKGWISEINMLKYLDDFSKGEYSDVFRKRMALYLSNIMTSNRTRVKELSQIFPEIISYFNLKQKIKYFILRNNLYKVFDIISKIQS